MHLDLAPAAHSRNILTMHVHHLLREPLDGEHEPVGIGIRIPKRNQHATVLIVKPGKWAAHEVNRSRPVSSVLPGDFSWKSWWSLIWVLGPLEVDEVLCLRHRFVLSLSLDYDFDGRWVGQFNLRNTLKERDKT